MPVPRVQDGKWSKERERTKSGRWRKKRSDTDQPRKKNHRLRYVLAALGIIALALILLYFFYPNLFKLPWF